MFIDCMQQITKCNDVAAVTSNPQFAFLSCSVPFPISSTRNSCVCLLFVDDDVSNCKYNVDSAWPAFPQNMQRPSHTQHFCFMIIISTASLFLCFVRVSLKNKNQLDATSCFIILMITSTWFGHFFALHQVLTTVVLITTWAAQFLGCCWLEVRCRQAEYVTVKHFTQAAWSTANWANEGIKNDISSELGA